MSILWYDGYDTYGDTAANMLDGVYGAIGQAAPSTTQARTGTRSLKINGGSGSVVKPLADDYTLAGAGFGLYMTNLPAATNPPAQGMVVMQFRNADGYALVSLQITTTGRIKVLGKGLDRNLSSTPTLLGTTTIELAPGVWNHIEVKIEVGVAVTVKINGRAALTTVGTGPGPSNGDEVVSAIGWGSFDGSMPSGYSGDWFWDDVFVWADDGAGVVDFIGMQSVYYLRPIADQNPQDWALTNGIDAFALIDETNPDDDADYIFSNAVDDISAFEVEQLPANIQSVAAISPLARIRKTDSGPCDVALGVNANSVVAMATDRPMTTAYGYYMDVFEQDPDTIDQWNPLALPLVQVERTL